MKSLHRKDISALQKLYTSSFVFDKLEALLDTETMLRTESNVSKFISEGGVKPFVSFSRSLATNPIADQPISTIYSLIKSCFGAHPSTHTHSHTHTRT